MPKTAPFLLKRRLSLPRLQLLLAWFSAGGKTHAFALCASTAFAVASITDFLAVRR